MFTIFNDNGEKKRESRFSKKKVHTLNARPNKPDDVLFSAVWTASPKLY